MLFERSFETGRIFVMKGSRRVLVKVVLFQLRGHSQPQNDATAIFFLKILNALYQGFQMKYHLLQKFFGKMVKIKETSFIFTRGITLTQHNCTCFQLSFHSEPSQEVTYLLPEFWSFFKNETHVLIKMKRCAPAFLKNH